MTASRYVIRELTGYSGNNPRSTTSVYVLDSDYGYEVAAAFLPGGFQEYSLPLDARRASAAALARKWNREHATWLQEAT